MIKIALVGLSGVGKDSIIPIDPDVYNLKLSKPIKDIAKIVFKFNPSYIEHFKDYKLSIFQNNKTLRHFYKELASLVKQYKPDSWINLFFEQELYKLYRTLERSNLEDSTLVISDVRFKYEIEALREEGFIFVYIQRKTHLPLINKVITLLGVNSLSRAIVYLINPKYAHFSEWSILQIKKHCDFAVNLPLDIKDNHLIFAQIIDTIEDYNRNKTHLPFL